MTTSISLPKEQRSADPFAGYVPHGPEWKAYMMKQPKALCIEVATGIANERDTLKAEVARLKALVGEAKELLYQSVGYALEAGRYNDNEGASSYAAEAKQFLTKHPQP